MDNEIIITPEILISLGFIEANEDNIPANFDIDGYRKNGCRCFIEKDLHRNLFAVVLEDIGNDMWDYSVWVMRDIGMGFSDMPLRWSELTVERLQDLYSAFMDKKLGE